MIRFTVPGEPKGKDRPKFRIVGKGARRFVQVYTPAETVEAEARVREAWEAAGAVVLPEDAGLDVELLLVVTRPATHFRKGGELSAEGLRHPAPFRTKPDVDNALKLVLDALNGAAWTDDVRVVRALVTRTWGSEPRTEVAARAVEIPAGGLPAITVGRCCDCESDEGSRT